VLGVATESAEMCEALKPSLDGQDFDALNMKEESGDVLWYLAVMFDALATSFPVEMTRVIAKLRTRFSDKFTEDAANNRDLFAERDTLAKSA
jgi:NTP pyrophosphatase (non-canonical NTP hydrolase)